MVYEIGYTRATEGLIEVSNLRSKREHLMNGLSLQKLKGGEAVPSLLWRGLESGEYALISVQTLTTDSEENRDIPLIYGYLMSHEEGLRLLSQPELIYSLWEKLKRAEKKRVLSIPKVAPMAGLEELEVQTEDFQPCSMDEEQVTRLIAYTLENENCRLCAFEQADAGQLYWALKRLPMALKETLSFSLNFNGAGAGASVLNLTSGEMINSLSQSKWEGYPNRKKVLARDYGDISTESQQRAESLMELHRRECELSLFKEYDTKTVICRLNNYCLLRRYQHGDKRLLNKIKAIPQQELQLLLPLLEQQPDNKLLKLAGLEKQKTNPRRENQETDTEKKSNIPWNEILLLVAIVFFCLTALEFVPISSPITSGTVLVIEGTGMLRLLSALLLGFALGRYTK